MPDPELRALRQRQMIEAFTRRHTPQKARKNLTYEEQLGATGKAENQVPLFAPEEDEVEERARNSDDEDMVEVVGETLSNPFDDEAVARNLQEQEFAEPSSPGVPDISEQMALEASRREAARRRDEEDLALLRALQASRTDARLQFVAGEKEPSIAATKSTASVLGDSDEDDFEEVEVPDIEATTFGAPISSPAPREEHHSDFIPSIGLGSLIKAPPLDSQDRTMIEAAIQKDQKEQSERTEPPVYMPEINDTPKKPVEVKSKSNAVKEAQMTPTSTYFPPSSKAYSGQASLEGNLSTTAVVHNKARSAIPETDSAQEQFVTLTDATILSPAGKNSHDGDMSQEVIPEEAQSTDALDQSVQNRFEISMNGLLGTEAEYAAVPSTTTRPMSPVRREPLPTTRPMSPVHREPSIPRQSPLREMNESGNNNFSESEEDDLDDSRSLEWSLSPEPEPRQTQTDTFPAPPPDLEEDEGGIDVNAEGDDYARFLASIKHRNLEQVRQEIDNEIRSLNQQNKVAMRDSEEITHQMVAQIQVRRYRRD